MSWVEELKPDDEVTVEIRFPKEYVESSINGIHNFSSGISHLCKGAVLLGDDETEFFVEGINVMQVLSIEKVMREFGIEMTHDFGRLADGRTWAYFYADLRGLRELFEGGELDAEDTM